MIKSISIITENQSQKVSFESTIDSSVTIDCSAIVAQSITSFDIEIVFVEPIALFRNHDYTWVQLTQELVANDFSPKIIKLANGFYIQPNKNYGIWQVSNNNTKKLIWKFNPQFSNPLATYTGSSNEKKIESANSTFDFTGMPTLFFSQKGAIEFSRSKIPFVGIACFTDHCDFDTPENLVKQRLFFKENNIKVTKGFFLNHFSKREDNASFQNQSHELMLWKNDQHELCYHSLSQSIKSKEESLLDFKSFSQTLEAETWIDHGYQPYNLSMYKKEAIDERLFLQTLIDNNITILWNYIDSGTATDKVLNQLNTNCFTLKSFYNGLKNHTFKTKIALIIKNAIVHYYADEKLIKAYSNLAASFKKMMKARTFPSGIHFCKKVAQVAFPLMKLLVFWNWVSQKKYPLARYQNLFFKHKIGDHSFIIFQTIELLDFINALNPSSIQELIQQKGVFIGHTYFSVPMEYHKGKIFDKNGEVNPKVRANFNELGKQIRANTLWNPTLIELVQHWLAYQETEVAIDGNGTMIVKNEASIPYKIVT
jgi:hypothetical protein